MKKHTTEFLNVLFCSLVGAASFLPAGSWARGNESGFAAHEWGTFTSVQGADGVLLDWRPLESSVLPKFVYDWTKPGLDRVGGGENPLIKRVLLTLQRLETPVIYFYSEQRRTVDVSVDFPKGTITEWYPQAAQIGPAFVPNQVKAGAALRESRAHWAEVEILPPNENRSLAEALPFDRTGSHYFAARKTDAAYLRVNSRAATNPAPQHEKFIFYRGAGSFATPLRVTIGGGNTVTITNTGSEPLVHLFVLAQEKQAGKYIHIDRLAPGEAHTVTIASSKGAKALDGLSSQLGKAMAGALVNQGLHPREASAMVNTWKDSWFAEDGLRVLYLLPRKWTDQILPLTIKPAPHELVRVMVGRAEVLTPAIEQRLSDAINKAKQGDKTALAELVAEFKTLGRFAEPALRLATRHSDKGTSEIAWKAYQDSQYPALAKTASVGPYE